MEGASDAGSKVKDERSDDDDITVVEDEDGKKESGDLNKDASSKNKESVDPEGSFEYNMQGVLDDEMSPLESRQDSHSTNVDSDVSGFHASIDHGLDQGGWSWSKDSEVQSGSREMPVSKGTVKVRRFQCGICGTNFTLLKNAKRHYRCQHLNYYYWCKYCPNGKETRRYTRREFLEDHFLSHHPDIMCEVAEVGKQVRTDEYNIVSVDIYEDEEEEEEVGVELVTTTDANLAGRSTLELASSRGAFEGSLLLQHAEQRENARSDINVRGNFINLADCHGFANDSHPSGSNASGSVQKRMQRTSPVNEQSSKVRRIENERNINLESDITYADGILHERDVTPSVTRWVSLSGQSLSSQVNITAPNQSALTSTRSQSHRQDGSFSGHPMLHAPSATTHDCLVIGSAITPVEKDMTLTPSPPSAQPSSKHASPQIASSSTRHPQGQSPIMQNTHHQQRRANHLLPNQRQPISVGNASGTGRNVTEEGNIVISSSDTTYRKQQRDNTQQQAKEVFVTEGGDRATASLSCKEIFEKYHDNIGKYSKEVNYKYDSSGRVVRRKIVKHVFVFSNSQVEASRQESAEMQAADRSASR